MKNPRIFFGWYIVGASVLLMIYHAGAMIYGFTAFIEPISLTFGWTYTQISIAMSLRGLESGVLEPLWGILVDRWPARRLAFMGVTLYGLGFLFVSQATGLAMFYAGFIIVGAGSSLGISMLPQATIARWFKRHLGKASGILYMGVGVGGALVPFLVIMIDRLGWQTTLGFLALGAWIMGLPLSFLFRTRPEEYGLLPDGKKQTDLKGPGRSAAYDFDTSVKEALKMRAFWHIGIASMLQMIALSALVTHIMPYFASIGMERSVAATFTMCFPLVSLAVRLPFGWFSDIFKKKYMMALSLGLVSVGLFFFHLLGHDFLSLTVPFIIIGGFGSGGMMPIRTPIIREYFGTKNFGKIYGLSHLFMTSAILIGAPLAGWVYDTSGTYDPIWLVFSVANMIGAIIILFTPLPSRSMAINDSQMTPATGNGDR